MRKDWEYKKWADVLTIINGKNQKAVESIDGTYPIYGSGGIMGYANDWLCPENCTIIGRKGNINKPIFVESKFWNVDTAFGLNSNQNLLASKYLYYFCLNYDFNRHNKAVTIPSLTKVDLLKIEMPLPPKPTQLAIVAELDKINELIQLKKQQLKDYDQLAQSIFYEMFGDPVENEKGWKVKKLGEMCSAITKGTTPTSIGFNFEKEGVNFVKVEAFGSNDRVDKEKLSFISEECHQNMLRSQLKENDILICIAGATVGKLSIVDFSILPANTNQACAIVRVKDKQVIFYSYLYGYLKYSYIQLVVNNLKKGVAQPNLSLGQIRDFNIKVPPLPLQQQFAARIEAIERQKQQVSETIKDLETLLASRMQYWFD